MQEVLIEAAEQAGAGFGGGRRPIKPGEPLVTTIDRGPGTNEISSRIVVCADGRSSAGKSRLGACPPGEAVRNIWVPGVMLRVLQWLRTPVSR
jgi:hypothetical protein